MQPRGKLARCTGNRPLLQFQTCTRSSLRAGWLASGTSKLCTTNTIYRSVSSEAVRENLTTDVQDSPSASHVAILEAAGAPEPPLKHINLHPHRDAMAASELGTTVGEAFALDISAMGLPALLSTPTRLLIVADDHVSDSIDDIMASTPGTEAPEVDHGPAAAEEPSTACPATFTWLRQWYPITATANLNAAKPYLFHLLGMPLVAWSTGRGSWAVGGYKTAKTADPNASASSSSGSGPPSGLVQYPVRLWQGLLWVWGDPSQEGALLAGRQEASGLVPELLHSAPGRPVPSSGYVHSGWFHRDLPVSYDLLLEHLQQAGGAAQEQPGGLQVVREVGPGGYTAELRGSSGLPGTADSAGAGAGNGGGGPRRSLSFQAPSLLKYQSGDTYITAQYVVPTRPGWSRLLQATAVNVRSPRFSSPLLARAAMALARLLPAWAHLTVRNAVLDEDVYRLHLLDRNRKASPQQSVEEHHTTIDAGVMMAAFRRWLADHGGEVPGQASTSDQLPPQLAPSEALDRWRQHTRQCRDCQKALAWVSTATTASKVLATGLTVAALAALAVREVPRAVPAGCLAAAAVAAALVWLLGQLQRKFYHGPQHA